MRPMEELPTEEQERDANSDTVVEETSDCSIEVNDFVAVRIETKTSKFCIFAKVIEVESDDVRVEYMEKRRQHYQYPDVLEESQQQKSEILCKLPSPESVITGSRFKCVF